MEVVLLERVENLGRIGDVVTVKPGYARNFLIPRTKALRATKANLAAFETQKTQLLADNATRQQEAEILAKKLDGMSVVLVRQAPESGKLYGSVATKDIADVVNAAAKTTINKNHVYLNMALKTLGIYTVKLQLHPEVSVNVLVNIARSAEEARTQAAKGLTVTDTTGAVEVAAATEAETVIDTAESQAA